MNKSKTIPIIILIIFIVLIIAKTNYLYFSDEYYIDDLIYSKSDNKPLNGYIYSDKFGYTTSYIRVVDGYIVGDYVYEVDGTIYEHDFYINDINTINKVKKIVSKDKLSLYLDKSDGKVYINIRILTKNMYNYSTNYFKEHKIMAQNLYKLFNNKKGIENIEFIYVDKLYLTKNSDCIRFSFKADTIEYYVHNYEKYKFVSDSAIYVP